MTLAEALDILVSRTRHARYREFCDPTHPDHDPAYAALVIRLASGVPEPIALEAPPLIPLAENLKRYEAVKRCVFRGAKVIECGCDSRFYCAAGVAGGTPTLAECLDCMAGA